MFRRSRAVTRRQHRPRVGGQGAQQRQRAAAMGLQRVKVAHQAVGKMLGADGLILQFLRRWFTTVPAILKGWVDRVIAHGFAYGVGEHSDMHRADRNGDGTLAGKRAMPIVPAGGCEAHYSPRGIKGPVDDLLFPINHGILSYLGDDVLPTLVTYRADRFNKARFEAAAESLRNRMGTPGTPSPIPYRCQNGGDYHIPSMQLGAERGERWALSFALHLKDVAGLFMATDRACSYATRTHTEGEAS